MAAIRVSIPELRVVEVLTINLGDASVGKGCEADDGHGGDERRRRRREEEEIGDRRHRKP